MGKPLCMDCPRFEGCPALEDKDPCPYEEDENV